MKMWVLYASEDRMVGPVGFRIRTVGVWCEQFGWVAKRHRFSYNVNRGVTLRTPESTVESDRRGKRHAGNRGMAAQTRDARQDKTVRSGRPVATERALPTTVHRTALRLRQTFDERST